MAHRWKRVEISMPLILDMLRGRTRTVLHSNIPEDATVVLARPTAWAPDVVEVWLSSASFAEVPPPCQPEIMELRLDVLPEPD